MNTPRFLRELFTQLADFDYTARPIKVYANNGTFDIQRIIVSEDDGTVYIDVTNEIVDLDATPR